MLSKIMENRKYMVQYGFMENLKKIKKRLISKKDTKNMNIFLNFENIYTILNLSINSNLYLFNLWPTMYHKIYILSWFFLN